MPVGIDDGTHYPDAMSHVLDIPAEATQSPNFRVGSDFEQINNAPAAGPNIMDVAKHMYPVLKDMDIPYTENFKDKPPYYLEAWQPGQTGKEGGYLNERPSSIPMDKTGIEVYNKNTRPIDILGDVASHFLTSTDPVIKQHYEDFDKSLTTDQQERLQSQYKRDPNQEKGSFDQWKKDSGLPAYFRGYAFDQWPKNEMDKLYTPEQRTKFDSMMDYLKGNPNRTPVGAPQEPAGALKGSSAILPPQFTPANLGRVEATYKRVENEGDTQVADSSRLDTRQPKPLPVVPSHSIAPHNPNPSGGGPYTIRPGERLSDADERPIAGKQYAGFIDKPESYQPRPTRKLEQDEDLLKPGDPIPSDWTDVERQDNGDYIVKRSLEGLSPKQLRERGYGKPQSKLDGQQYADVTRLLRPANDNKNLDLGFPGEDQIMKSWNDMAKKSRVPALKIIPGGKKD